MMAGHAAGLDPRRQGDRRMVFRARHLRLGLLLGTAFMAGVVAGPGVGLLNQAIALGTYHLGDHAHAFREVGGVGANQAEYPIKRKGGVGHHGR